MFIFPQLIGITKLIKLKPQILRSTKDLKELNCLQKTKISTLANIASHANNFRLSIGKKRKE